MMLVRYSFIVWLFVLMFAGAACGQVTIDGPDVVDAGRLCVLRLSGLTGSESAEWLIISRAGTLTDPVRGVDWEVFEAGRVCVFATPNPGRYLVLVASSPTSGNVVLIAHEVTVGNPPPPPPTPPNPEPGPQPGPGPGPTPPGPVLRWEQLAREKAMSLVASPRAAEAKKVADALRTAASQVTDVSDFRKARELVREKTREALGTGYVRWLDWSRAVGDEIAKSADEIKDLEDYKEILIQLAAGLEKVTDG